MNILVLICTDFLQRFQSLSRFQCLDLNAVDSLGKTPLFWLVMHGIPEITRLLIDNGADIDKATLPTRSLLHWAAWQGNDEVIQCLLESGVYFA